MSEKVKEPEPFQIWWWGFLKRPEKLGDNKDVYFIAKEWEIKDGNRVLVPKRIERGTIGHVCLTTSIWHVNTGNSTYYCFWDDMEPVTNEGKEILEKLLEKENITPI